VFLGNIEFFSLLPNFAKLATIGNSELDNPSKCSSCRARAITGYVQTRPRIVLCFHDGVTDVLEGNEPKVRNTNISLAGPVQAVLARLL
jgi:hypothetical protein